MDVAKVIQQHKRLCNYVSEKKLKQSLDILADMINSSSAGDMRDEYEKIVELTAANNQMKASALVRLGHICIELKDLSNAAQYLQNALEINQTINVFTAEQVSEITEILQTSKNQNNM